MQRPNHPFIPTTLKNIKIHTGYLNLAIHLQGQTEEDEHEILAGVDKPRIDFEKENVYCYHSLCSSIKPRKNAHQFSHQTIMSVQSVYSVTLDITFLAESICVLNGL